MPTTNPSGFFNQLPNKLQGNINENVNLVYIFQTISQNQQYGWLFLRHVDYETGLYFKGDRVALVSISQDRFKNMPWRLYYAGKLGEEDISHIQQAENQEEAFMQLVDPKVLEALKDRICYEEICRFFSWEECYYEFVSIHDPDANPDLVPIQRFFEVEGILAEVELRKQEKAELDKNLPDLDELLIQIAPPDVPSDLDEPMQNIYHLANERSVQDIMDLAYSEEFDSKRIILTLLQEKNIELMKDQDIQKQILDLQQDLSKEDQLKKAVHYCEILYKRHPFSPEIVQLLANCYEQTDQKAKLQDLYYGLSQQWLSSENPEEQILGALYLKRFCDVAVESNEVIESRIYLFNMVIQGAIDGKTIDYNLLNEGKKLFQLLRTRKSDQEARQILEQLLQIHPHDKYLHGQYINICLDLGDNSTAITEYETMAKIYERDKNWPELVATYQKIIRLAPQRKEIAKKLDIVQLKLRKGKAWFSTFIKFLLLLALAVGGWWLYQKYLENIAIIPENPIEVKPSQPTEIIGLDARQKQIDQDALEKLQSAQTEFAKKEWQTARKILVEILTKEPSEPIKAQVQEEIQKIDELVQEQTQTLQNFQQYLLDAQNFEKAGEWRKAISIYLGLWKNEKFLAIPERNQIRLPIFLNVSPKKVQVLIDQEPAITLQSNEEVIRCHPEFAHMTLQMQGYQSLYFYNSLEQTNPKSVIGPNQEKLEPLPLDGKIIVNMEKAALWEIEFASKSKVESTPCYAENVLYVATSKGIEAFGNVSGTNKPQFLWSWRAPEMTTFRLTPCYAEGILYVAANSGRLYALDTRQDHEPTVLATYQLKKLNSFASAPALVPDLRLIVFATTNGEFCCLPLATARPWQPIWQVQIKGIRSSPVIAGDQVLFGTTEGFLYSLEARTGKILRRIQVNRPIYSSVAVSGNIVYVVAKDICASFDMDQGTKLAETQIQGYCEASIFLKNRILYFATTEKTIYAIHAQDLQIKWKQTMPEKFKSTPAVNDKEILYIGSQSIPVQQGDKTTRISNLYALDAEKGTLLWEYKLQDDLPASPVVIGDIMVQAANKLYGFLNN